MAFTLRIVFDGIIALTTPQPDEAGDRTGEAVFLFPDVRLGDCIAEIDIPPHPTRVIFPTLEGETRTWFLDGEELHLTPEAGEPRAGGVSLHDSLSTVARIASCTDGKARLDEKIVTHPGESRSLTGLWRFQSGLLSGGPVSDEEHEFRESLEAPGKARGRYAESIEVKLDLPGKSAHLGSTGFCGDLRRKATVAPLAGEDEAVVRVTSRCAADLSGDRPISDPDFLAYYRLAAGFRGPFRFPFLVEPGGERPRAVYTSSCIPARF